MSPSEEKPRPPYFRYAFKNPYNYAIMGGFASAAVLTGNWWLGLFGAGVEALWLLFAPDSRLLRKLWFDKRWATELDAARKAELDAKFKSLPESEAMRCLGGVHVTTHSGVPATYVSRGRASSHPGAILASSRYPPDGQVKAAGFTVAQ